MTKEDIFYEAMLARDARFDGKFFVGVKTTGIYCRPVCPAKPARKNVEFFSHALEAEQAGYRPCMRCRPESAPLSPVWIGKSAMVNRALRMINFENSLLFNEDHFAELFGVSARHLRRVFVEEIGKTPKQVAFENRLNLSRQLIVETSLPMTEIAHASGFSSIRRFNSAFKERFKKNPTLFRRQKNSDEEGLVVYLPYRPPYDFQGLLDYYRHHRIGPLETFENDKMIRKIFYDGKSGVIEISQDADHHRLKIKIDFSDTSHLGKILANVRLLFDLDSDPVTVANALESDPIMKKMLKKYPGIRLPSGWDNFEISIGVILGQLVSVEQGRKLMTQLIELSGAKDRFPTPSEILQADLTKLATTLKRKETLRIFCQAIQDGSLSLQSTQDVEAFEKKLLSMKGIGPWTASLVTLKALRHTDAFPKTDLIIARALKRHEKLDLARISPWRAYAAIILWREYAVKLSRLKS